MTTPRKAALALFLFCLGVSILWGLALSTRAANGSSGFQAVYYGTKCLLQHHNPYNQSELSSVYRAEGGEYPTQSHAAHESVTLYVNFPTTFVFLTPFAMLPYGAAHALWLILIAVLFALASLMVFDLGASYSRGFSLFLVCVLVGNAEIIVSSGNTAGVVVSLCVIGTWCFLKDRFVPAGILCLGFSLAIKPHVVGLVWLYFLLAGGANRKRALQSLIIPVVVGLSAFFWVSHVAPGWMDDWRSNLSAISSPGGINQPGPYSITGRTPDMIVDLQSAISVFKDDPRVYNPISFLVCGSLILLWSIRSFRASFSLSRALLALAAVVPLTILVTYHRPYDAKILLLSIPACAMLSSAGDRVGRIALLVTTAAIVLTADIPLAILVVLAGRLHVSPVGFVGKTLTTLLLRPAPIAMLVMACFYLWAFMRTAEPEAASSSERPANVVNAAGPESRGPMLPGRV